MPISSRYSLAQRTAAAWAYLFDPDSDDATDPYDDPDEDDD